MPRFEIYDGKDKVTELDARDYGGAMAAFARLLISGELSRITEGPVHPKTISYPEKAVVYNNTIFSIIKPNP